MDYSLVCGVRNYYQDIRYPVLPNSQVDSQNNELVIGIVGESSNFSTQNTLHLL